MVLMGKKVREKVFRNVDWSRKLHVKAASVSTFEIISLALELILAEVTHGSRIQFVVVRHMAHVCMYI